jgi:ABC-2 type transport system permease protein
MRNIWNVAFNDLRIYMKEPSALLNMFVIPVMIAVVLGIGLGSSGGATQLRIDVMDSDQTVLSKQFLNNLRQANNTLVLCPMDNSKDDFCQLKDDPVLTEDRSIARLSNNTSLALIEIPKGFEAALQAGQPETITYRSNENAAAPSYILQAVQAVVQKMSGALTAVKVGDDIISTTNVIAFADDAQKAAFEKGVYDSASATWSKSPFRVDFKESAASASNQLSSTQRGFGQTIPGIGSMFVTIFVMTSMISLVQERKNGTLQRMATLPVSRSEILAGKILMYFLLGMIQFAALFAVGKLLGLNLGNDPLALVAVMVCLSLCTTAMGFAIGTFVRTEMQGAAVVNLLGLTLAPLGGAWWPLDIVPDFMKTVGHISPIAWSMDAFHTLLYNNGTLSMILPQLAVLLVLAVVFFVIAIRRFRFD